MTRACLAHRQDAIRGSCIGYHPEAYLRDLLRVLAHWPSDRYLELAPRYWKTTRARLDTAEVDAEIGPLTVPPAHPTVDKKPAD